MGDTLAIWEVEGHQNTTNTFELWATISSLNNHPYITWNPFNNIAFTATHYEIWRGQSPDGSNTPLSYSLLATVNVSTHSYLDNQLTIGSSSKYFYKVRAKNSTQYSLFGNKVATKAMVSEKLVVSNIIKAHNFSLSQNHPNPFNPGTVISYQLSAYSNVVLKVYDVLGNEVATLVDEYRSAGVYEVRFNASLLSSGLYFYQLRTGDYIQTRKMLLMK